jgi:diguanylate cyclase (GGDEF)-like protein
LQLRQWIGGTAEIERRLRDAEERAAQLELLLDERTRQLEEAGRTLRRMATIDPLTGIANHRYFRDFLDSEWRRAAREQAPVTVLMIDLDEFKSFNDAFGHQAGDECLRRVASALSAGVGRAGDLVARYGGEEFVAVLGNTDTRGGLVMAERLRARVETLSIPHPRAAAESWVTVSIGAATLTANRQSTPDDLVGLADAALVAAKREGRNRVGGVPEGAPPERTGQVLPFRPADRGATNS